MHLRILPGLQKHFFKKDIFYRLEWLKLCFDAFAHTSIPPETFFKKDIFDRLEWIKTCFDAFAHSASASAVLTKITSLLEYQGAKSQSDLMHMIRIMHGSLLEMIE